MVSFFVFFCLTRERERERDLRIVVYACWLVGWLVGCVVWFGLVWFGWP